MATHHVSKEEYGVYSIMSLRQEAKTVAEVFHKICSKLDHNHVLFDIYEGNLLPYVVGDLKEQLSKQAFENAKFRIPPINLLRRLIDKVAKLYNKPPIRKIEPETEQNKALLDMYVNAYNLNIMGVVANEFFNLFKSTSFEPYLDNKAQPKLRVVPSDRAFAISLDPVDPMRMTHYVKVMGNKVINGKEKLCLYVYTDSEFLVIDDSGEVLEDVMRAVSSDGTNPYGVIPFSYAVKSYNSLNPPIDTDTLTMTKLFPVLMADLNYAVMFQCFSIIYGIDIDEENLKLAPNMFWRFKKDPTSTGEPKVGVIKPEVDSDKVIQLIQAELSMWLQSRNIRPGSVGQITPENFSSGISKMVDEMDTVEERQKQVSFFKKLEEDLWDITINHLHPEWIRIAGFPVTTQFVAGSKVTVEFPEQLPLVDRAQLLEALTKELQQGLTTKKIALKKLNPEMSEDEIDELLQEIEDQNTVEIEETESEKPEEEVAEDGE